MDEPVTQPNRPPLGVRLIDDVDTLKALADPLRTAILRVTMDRTQSPQPRSWTAKELAVELGEPQTKLYRHIKQLEQCGLLRVEGTRLVSGIVEQRYVAAQTDIEIGRDFLDRNATSDDKADLFAAGMDAYRRELLAAVRSGKVDLQAQSTTDASYRRPVLAYADLRLPAHRAAEFRDRLALLVEEFLPEPAECAPKPSDADADAVNINFIVGFVATDIPG